jgi:hypothetical protein
VSADRLVRSGPDRRDAVTLDRITRADGTLVNALQGSRKFNIRRLSPRRAMVDALIEDAREVAMYAEHVDKIVLDSHLRDRVGGNDV